MSEFREYRPNLASEGMLATVTHYPYNDVRLAWAISLMDGAEFLIKATQRTLAEWEMSS